ncbi:MAG: hypothetical protein JSV17_16590 [Candidatus Aminicenantes bacterium]|nr:MAG: hypothetical protein JSV17_16590 [Candidatus Aminicenantes bacterium]
MNFRNRTRLWAISVFVLLGIFVCSMINCKSPENPDEITARIVVSNEYGIEIDVYMEGVYQFWLEFLYYEVIENVSAGVYVITANKKDTEEEISRSTVNIDTGGEYWVAILSSASLTIINGFGETLNIYTNSSLQGELGDQESLVIDNVPFGDHVLEASMATDNSLVAFTVISVVEEKEYTWTIK